RTGASLPDVAGAVAAAVASTNVAVAAGGGPKGSDGPRQAGQCAAPASSPGTGVPLDDPEPPAARSPGAQITTLRSAPVVEHSSATTNGSPRAAASARAIDGVRVAASIAAQASQT